MDPCQGTAEETSDRLESAGQTCHDFRAARTVKKNEGLTDTYTHCHDPNERSPDILKLREFHAP